MFVKQREFKEFKDFIKETIVKIDNQFSSIDNKIQSITNKPSDEENTFASNLYRGLSMRCGIEYTKKEFIKFIDECVDTLKNHYKFTDSQIETIYQLDPNNVSVNIKIIQLIGDAVQYRNSLNNKPKRKQRKRISPKDNPYPGLCWHSRNKKWQVTVGKGANRRHIGSFIDKYDAIAAWRKYN